MGHTDIFNTSSSISFADHEKMNSGLGGASTAGAADRVIDLRDTTLVTFKCLLSTCEHPHECVIQFGYLPIFPECPFCSGRIQCPCKNKKIYIPEEKEEETKEAPDMEIIEDNSFGSTEDDSDIHEEEYNESEESYESEEYNQDAITTEISIEQKVTVEEDVSGILPITKLKWNTAMENAKRCGVFPYTKINDKLFICTGLDARYNEYCDFGGKIEKYDRGNPVLAALREWKEESRSIFDNYDIKKSYCILPTEEYKHFILFVPVDPKYVDYSIAEFDNRRSINKEMRTIKWMSERRFKATFFSQEPTSAWDFIRNRFLSSNITFDDIKSTLT